MGVDAEVVGMGDVDGKIYIELGSAESGILIGKRGQKKILWILTEGI